MQGLTSVRARVRMMMLCSETGQEAST
jgi:hypothetical protein